MKVIVKKPFADKFTKKMYNAGQELDFDDKRAASLIERELAEAVATSQQETSDIPMNKPEESEQAAGDEKEDKPEEPIIPKAEEESEKEESPESAELPENEEEGKPEKPEEPKAEEAKEDKEPEQDDKDTIHNQAAFRSAKDALVRINQAFEEGQYRRAMDMADAFSMHLDIALRRTV